MYFEREGGRAEWKLSEIKFSYATSFFVFSSFYIQKLFQKFCDEKKISLYIRIKVKFTFKFNLYFIICMDIVVKLFV